MNYLSDTHRYTVSCFFNNYIEISIKPLQFYKAKRTYLETNLLDSKLSHPLRRNIFNITGHESITSKLRKGDILRQDGLPYVRKPKPIKILNRNYTEIKEYLPVKIEKYWVLRHENI